MEAGLMFGGICVFLILTLHVNNCRADTIKRQVRTKPLHPQPKQNDTSLNLFHTTAEGPHDTLHYISGTYGLPTLFVARTEKHAVLEVDWPHFLSDNLSDVAHSIKFSTTPLYVYGIQFLQLIEYNDLDDEANLSKASPNTTFKYDLSFGIQWSNSSQYSDPDRNQIVFRIDENHTDDRTNTKMTFLAGGSLSFKIQINDDTKRSTQLPHLQLTANTSQIDVIIDRMMAHYEKSRYGLEMYYISTDPAGLVQLNKITSIDDEHTPGVFQIVDINTNTTPTSFIQWKPVCYKSVDRAMKTATKVKDYPLQYEDRSSCGLIDKKSILFAYFGDNMCSKGQYSMTVFNVSFGLSQDKFYTHTNYTAWSFILGYGEVSPEKISLLIIIIISVGLGIPVLLIIFGSFGALIHKKKRDNKVIATGIN